MVVLYLCDPSANASHVFKTPFLCRWASCQRQFGMDSEPERDVHLEGHTIRPLPCPFTGEKISARD